MFNLYLGKLEFVENKTNDVARFTSLSVAKLGVDADFVRTAFSRSRETVQAEVERFLQSREAAIAIQNIGIIARVA